MQKEFSNSPTGAIPVQAGNIHTAKEQMFNDFCQLMDRESIKYVILSGYQGYPKQIDSDVDFMVSESDFARLPKVFRQAECIPGSQLIQAIHHETTASYFVFTKRIGPRNAYLHPDAASNYRRGGRLWLHSEAVLATRRQSPQGFWIPAPAVEFGYYLVKRIDKTVVETRHLQALALLFTEDPVGCRAVLNRYFDPYLANAIDLAIAQHDTSWFASNRAALRTALNNSLPAENRVRSAIHSLYNLGRTIKRVLQPTGLVIAVLGPDGSGKTTVIEHLEAELAPAFRRTKRFHLRPHFGRSMEASAPVTNPHAQIPRSSGAGVLKTLMFIADYWSGWIWQVYPAKVRSTLVVFDRYYHDMLVDPARYRLTSGFALPKLLAWMVPQPDLWLILDAPPAMLVKRKSEITLQAAHTLSANYRALANTLPNANLIDSGGGLPETLANVVNTINNKLAQRMKDQGPLQ